jgi:hypothetical protein
MTRQSEQEREWRAYESQMLRRRRCPHSGAPLTRDGEAGVHALSCEQCDCFGYNPDDLRIGKIDPK